MKIYVASSWRNKWQPDVVKELRNAEHEVYDFRNPKDGDIGFHWSEIDLNWEKWTTYEFSEALDHPIAVAGFDSDMRALMWCDAVIYVLPCGRSASLEAGWAKGAGKLVYALSCEDCEPELMYKMLDGIYGYIDPLLKELETINANATP